MAGAGKAARYAVLAAGALHVIAYVAVAASRMGYPFELEWMEGAQLGHVRRVLAGRSLYVRPSLSFVPTPYPPLFSYVSAGFAAVLGVGFTPLRLVSFLASAGSLALVYRLVARETGVAFSGAVAACLFAATYRLCGFWFDVGRVDSLFLLLVLGAAYVVRFGSSRGWPYVGGALLALAFFTKQTALPIAAALATYRLVVDRRGGARLAATAAALIVGGTALLDALHAGWLTYYVFRVPTGFVLDRPRLLSIATDDLLKPLPVAILGAGYSLRADLRGPSRRRGLFYALMAAGMIGPACASRALVGGYRNALMPAFAALAVLFGLGVDRAMARARAARSWLPGLGVCLLCVVQFGLLAYDPAEQVPTAADRAAGRRLVATLAALDGEVLVQSHDYLLALAGKRPHAHASAVFNVMTSGTAPGAELFEAFREALRRQRFRAIVCDEDTFRMRKHIEEHYVPSGRVFGRRDVFFTVTGTRTRPEVIYIPKPRGLRPGVRGVGAPSSR